MEQAELFQTAPSGIYFVPSANDITTPMCWDCAFFQRDKARSLDGICNTRKMSVVYEGSCGRFVKSAKREMFKLREWEA